MKCYKLYFMYSIHTVLLNIILNSKRIQTRDTVQCFGRNTNVNKTYPYYSRHRVNFSLNNSVVR